MGSSDMKQRLFKGALRDRIEVQTLFNVNPDVALGNISADRIDGTNQLIP